MSQPINLYAPPPEAFPPAPRAFRLRRIPYTVVVFVLFMVTAGILMCCVSIVPLVLIAAGDGLGSIVPGRITDKTQRGRGGKSHIVKYAYEVDGWEFKAEMDVTAESFEAVKVGDPIKVHVAPIIPGLGSVIEEPKLRGSINSVCFIAFVVLWNGITLCVLIILGKHALRFRRLASSGTPALGRITDKTVSKGKSNTYILSYRYRGAGGDEHEGTMSVASDHYQAIQVGQTVTVLYDPVKPQWSIIYRCGDYEVVGVG